MPSLLQLSAQLAKLLATLLLFATSLIPSRALVAQNPLPAPASSTVAVASTSTLAQKTTATSSKAAAKPQKAPAAAKQITPPPSPAPQQQTPEAPSVSPEVLNAQARAALVNILCTTQSGGSFKPISGSGVIIDSRGVILTNAHVAQFFLLRDYVIPNNVQCIVRTGSPAVAAYTAQLLYLSPAWVDANASQITSDEPMGTGENDFAFLEITGTTNLNTALPAAFPSLPMTSADPEVGDRMLIAAYPAGFLDGINIQENLYASSAFATVEKLFIFNDTDTWVDLFSVPGTIASQAGSSGGAVVRADNGKLSGIVVTASAATTTGERDLRALSLAHIEHSLVSQGMDGIEGILQQNLDTEADNFAKNTAPTLTKKLEDVLNGPRN